MVLLLSRAYADFLGVTIYDIAERANVSIATVSRVLNHHARVSSKTRERVLQVALELGYQPHPSAQSLARRKSSLVSAVIPMMTNYFFMEVVRGLQDRLAESEFDLLVYTARAVEEVGDQTDRALHRGRAAGVMIFSSPLDDERISKLRRSGQPTVLVDCTHPDFDSVSIDNELGGYLATRHLLKCGHSRVGLVMAHPDSVPAHDRYLGYCRAMSEAGQSIDTRLIAASDDLEEHGFSEGQGYRGMSVLLDRERPDAVFVTSDVQALGVLSVLRERGLRVPVDVAVIGFDDIYVSRHIGLSTLRQPMYEMGRLATEKLLARIEDPERMASHTVFSPRLVARRSTVGEENEVNHEEATPSAPFADTVRSNA